jgi:hypothetical protein
MADLVSKYSTGQAPCYSTKMGKRPALYHRSPSHSTILEHYLLSPLRHARICTSCSDYDKKRGYQQDPNGLFLRFFESFIQMMPNRVWAWGACL